jgi:hypothetical protein
VSWGSIIRTRVLSSPQRVSDLIQSARILVSTALLARQRVRVPAASTVTRA